MIVLGSAEGGAARRLVVVVGRGLIGSALASRMVRDGWSVQDRVSIDWQRSGGLTEALERVDLAVRQVSFVWSAGRAGFGSGEAETQLELEHFQHLVDFVDRCAKSTPSAHGAGGAGGGSRRIAFHMISSAGGLFEGRRLVDGETEPAPRRPYGRLKLAQERYLADCRGARRRVVYRLTAVFGYGRPERRMGLIPTLVMNGLRHGVSTIEGRMTTLREFVWIEDLTAYLAARIEADSQSDGESVVLLASGRPCSILEIRSRVEEALGRRIYLSLSQRHSNDEDITFAPSALPPDWRSTDLPTAIRRVTADAISEGVRPARFSARGAIFG